MFQWDSEKKTFYRAVAALVLPMAAQNIINVANQAADVVMVTFVGESALSAASLAGQVQFIMMLLIFGLSSGASVLTAQYWGKGDTRTMEKVFSIALRLSMAVGLLFCLAALFIPGQLMRIFTPEEEIIRLGVLYLRIVAPSYLCIAFATNYLVMLRSMEKVVFAAVVYSVSLVTNVVFNSIFIFGLLGMPAMGIQGAALATTIARVVEVTLVVVYALRNPVLRLRKKDFFSLHKHLFADFKKYSMPTVINEAIWGLGASASVAIIGHLGSAAVAASSVNQVIRQLATVVCFGIANAAAILVGKAAGADDFDKARLYSGRLIRLSILFGVGGCGVILLLRPLVLRFAAASLSQAALDHLAFMLTMTSVQVMLIAVNCTFVIGILRGGGDTRFGLFVDTAFLWGVSILLGAVAAFVLHWPAQAVFAILLLDELIKTPVLIWRYKSGVWLRNITR